MAKVQILLKKTDVFVFIIIHHPLPLKKYCVSL